MNPSGSDNPADTSSASEQQVTFDALNTGALEPTGSLDADVQSTQAIINQEEAATNAQLHAQAQRHNRWRLIRFASLLVFLVVGLALVWWRHSVDTSDTTSVTQADASQRYDNTTIPLATISDNSSALSVGSAQTLSVNGQLNVNNSLVIAPTTRPDGAVTGQLYYDQATNKLAYYNGSSFVNILSGSLPVPTPPTSINGVSGTLTTGSGITIAGSQLSNTGVLSLQGQTGDLSFAAGPGIVVDGTTLSNSGLLSLGGRSGDINVGNGLGFAGNTLRNTGIVSATGSGIITVTNDGFGNIVISGPSGSGSGTVSSPGGTVNKLARFTGAQTIADSLISDNGATVTVSGPLQVTGTVTLDVPLAVTSGGTGSTTATGARTNLGAAASGNNSDITQLSGLTTALSVTQGGTGIGTLPTNSVLIGNGTSPISGITGTDGQCLIINGSGQPVFGSCPGASGGGGVNTLNSLDGDISIANATTSGQIITLNDAKADSTTKGIATYSDTNFSDNGAGVISIKTGGVSSTEITDHTVTGTDLALSTITNDNLTNGSYDAITSANNLASATSLVSVGTLTSGAISWSGDITTTGTINGTTINQNGHQVCDTSGNCVGSGASGAIGGSGIANKLALFTNSGYTIGDSMLSQDANATTVTVAGDITTAGTVTAGSFSGDGTNVTNVDAATLQGQTANYFTNASNINNGTLGDSYLSSNVAFYDRTTSNFTGILQHAGNDVCDMSGNCVGSSGGGIGGSGAVNTIAMFTGTGYSVTNSLLSQDSGNTTVTVGGNLAANTTATTDNGVSITNSTITTGNVIDIANTSGGNTSGNTANITNTATMTTANQNQSGSTLNVNRNLTANVTTVPSIALDSSKSTAGGASTSLSVTVGNGSNRYLIVTTSTAIQYGTSSVSSVKYNGIPLTRLVRQAAAGTETPETAIWGLANPPSGTYTLTAISGGGNIIMTATSWNNVAQTGTVDGTYTSHGSSGNLSGTVTSTANDLVIDSQGVAYPTGAGVGTPGAGQTQIGRLTSTWIGGNASYKIASGNSTTMVENSAAFDYAYAVVALKMAGGTAFVTGAAANIASNCTATAGNCADSSNVLNLQQQYASATGDVLNTSNAGTGAAINIAQTGALASSKAVITVNDTHSASDILISLQQNGTAQFTVDASGNVTAGGIVTANAFTGNGASVTNVNALTLQGNSASYFTNASNISSGTLADGRLSTNVVLRNGNNTGTSSISGNTNFTGTLTHNSNSVCDTSGNCTGVAGGGIGGNGSANTIAMFNGSGYTIGNSLLTQDASATTVSITGNLTATGTVTAAFFDGDGSAITNVNALALQGNTASYFTDASNIDAGQLGDSYLSGNVALYDRTTSNFTGTLEHNGNDVCDSSNNCGYLTGAAANNSYVQIGPSGAQSDLTANPSIFINDTGGGNLIQLQSSGTDKFVVTSTGDTTISGTLTLTGNTTANRPTSPTKGMLYYDTSTNQLLQYNGTKWVGSQKTAMIVAASNSSQADKDAADYVATGSDDQNTINTALSALPSGGGTVYLEEGTYNLGTTSISMPNNTTLAGTGAGTKLTWPNTLGNYGMMAITNTDTTTGTQVVVRDLVIDGNSTSQSAGSFYGIYFSGMGGGNGTSARAGAKITNIIAKNLYQGNGIYLNNSSNNTLSNNTFQNDPSGITTFGSGNVISNNIVQGNSVRGIGLYNGSNNTIADNTVQGSGGYGIYVDAATASTISGNTINGVDYGIELFNGAAYDTVSGNTIDSATTYGLYVYTTTHSTISGNTVDNTGGSTANNAIFLDLSSTNSLTDNNIIDTSCTSTCYAINIGDSGSANNYLSGNAFTGDGINPATIQDLGTGTIYDGQMTSSTGDFRFKVNTNSSSAFQVQNANGITLLGVDSTNMAVSINGGLTISGNVAYTHGTDFSITGTSNNVNFGTGVLFRLTGSSAQTITGIAGGTDGRQITLINAATQAATLKNSDTADSSAANTIITGTGSDLNIAAGASVSLVYDSVSSVWRVVGTISGGESGGSYVSLQTSTPGTPDDGSLNISGAALAASGLIKSDSTNAFAIQNSSGDTLLNADTANGKLTVGTTPTLDNAKLTVAGDAPWTIVSNIDERTLQSVTYGDGLFVAIPYGSSGDTLVTSHDGLTWDDQTAAEANSWQSVTYGDGLFVAVSTDGTHRVMTSPDGINWTAQTAAASTYWYSVTYGNGLFVAVSYLGGYPVMTSPDGITWTSRLAPSNSWWSVTYGNGLFVAVGSNKVMTSPDGINWTAQTAAEANNWMSVTYGDGLFVAVANAGTHQVMTSPDGINWTAQTAAEANNWMSVTYGDGLFVAVSTSGTHHVMTSSLNPVGLSVTGGTILHGNTSVSTTSAMAWTIQNASGGSLFTADTANMQVIIGDSSSGNYITIDSTGLTAHGTARHTKQIALTAEYAGAVLDAAGDSSCVSANNGSMTSGNDSSANYMSYYKWTTSSASAQCYDVVVRVPLPSDFDGWASSTPLTLQTWTSDVTNGTIAIQARDTSSTSTVESGCNYAPATPGTTNGWTAIYSSCTIAGTYTANGVMVLHLRMSAQNGAEVRIGDLTLNYKSKF